MGSGWRVGVLGLGIGIPLALHLLQVFGGGRSRTASNAAAVSALVGGFLLRAVFVFGGRKSAAYPRDYFNLTR